MTKPNTQRYSLNCMRTTDIFIIIVYALLFFFFATACMQHIQDGTDQYEIIEQDEYHTIQRWSF